MPEETIHESEESRSRRGIASYLRRLAGRLGRGKPAPVDEAQTVTVNPPEEADFEVEVETKAGNTSLEIELTWPQEEGEVETDVVASKATFDLYEDAEGKWRWRLVHDNGNIIADGSEGYSSKQKAKQGLDSVKRNAPGAYVVDQSKDDGAVVEKGGSNAAFEVYEDAEGKWRWRLVHDNGDIIADGGQGYSSKQKAKQGLGSVQKNVRGALVEEQD